MLQFNPIKRSSPEELLKHPFLSPLNCDFVPKDCGTKIPLKEFEFEALKLNTEQLKDVAYEEILCHHFEKYREIWRKRLECQENGYLEFLENENKEFNDGEDEEFEESEDSFCLGD